jgi:hypothetical protein
LGFQASYTYSKSLDDTGAVPGGIPAAWAALQFRAEFFNIFNIVNFGWPSHTLLGTGLGIISKTAGPSRQIQFSLRLAF